MLLSYRLWLAIVWAVIVGVVNQKGGVGKSTIAVHLAAAWARRHRVLLVDADPQASALAWLSDPAAVGLEVVQPRTTGLSAFLEAQAAQYDVVVTDTPPGLGNVLREVVRAADLLVVPLHPTPVDIKAVRGTLELVQILRGRDVDVRLVLSRGQPQTVLDETARAALAPYGVPILRTRIHQRVAIAEAGGTGRPVFTYAPDSLAADEFAALARELGREVFQHGVQVEEARH
jgi:chromosome partitioning protein